MKKKLVEISGIAVVCMSLLTLTACQGNKEEDSSAASSNTAAVSTASSQVSSDSTANEPAAQTLTEKEKKELTVIGTKTGAKNEYEMVISNQTGAALEKLAIKDITVSKFEGNLLEKTAPFNNEEQGLLYFTPSAEAAASESAAEEETTENTDGVRDWAIIPGYDLSFTTKEGQDYVIHSFPLDDAKEVTLFIEGPVAYLEYVSITTGESISTLEMEKALSESATSE